jgi:hypothetical protein
LQQTRVRISRQQFFVKGKTMMKHFHYTDSGEMVLEVADLAAHQEEKPHQLRRKFRFMPPGEFADRVGRAVSLHVERGDWRQAHHTIDAAERESQEIEREMDGKSSEERAAATPLSMVDGMGQRELNILTRFNYITVADVMRASFDDLDELPELGRVLIRRVREAIKRAGF